MFFVRFRNRKDTLFIVTVLLCWIWINIWIALRYEPWRDVAQSWMIVRQLSLPEVFAQLKNEGHPCLWFLVLFPLAKAGLPFYTIIVVSFLLVFAGLLLFLLYAPLQKTGKLIVVFSAMGMYYLPVIARNYALIPLLFMLVYRTYPKRFDHPIRYAAALFLVCQTHVLLLGLVSALSLQWAIEALPLRRKAPETRRGLLAAAIILLAAFVFVLWQLNGGLGTNKQLLDGEFGSLSELLRSVFNAVSEIGEGLTTLQLYERGNTVWTLGLVPFALAAAGIWIVWCLRAPRSATALLIASLWHVAINVLIYPLTHMQHFLSLLWMLLLCVMLALDELKQSPPANRRISNQALTTALTSVVLAIALLSCAVAYTDIRTECSNTGINSKSVETAAYINTELPEDAVVLIDSEIMATPVAALCAEGKLYNPIRHNYHIFALYDDLSEEWCVYGDLDAEIEALRTSGVTGPLYLLVDIYAESEALALSDRSAADLELIRRFAGKTVWQEQYLLYRIIEPT